MTLSFTVNGRPVSVDTDPRRRLLDVLRDDCGLTGVKEGCGEGECGACSVLLDGRLVNSCITAAGAAAGADVLTIEGFRETPRYRALEEAFAEAGAVQCGFCIPGMIMAAEALFRENPRPSREDIRRGIAGNLCRCTGYATIVEAVELAVRRPAGHPGGTTPPGPAAPGADVPDAGSPEQGGEPEAFFPRTVDEALRVLARGPAIPYAGGTDLMVKSRRPAGCAASFGQPLLFLGGIPELRTVTAGENGILRIGSCVTLAELLRAEETPAILRAAVRESAAPAVRSSATLGGNICNASPAGDCLPPLYVLEARVELVSAGGRRILAIGEFIRGPGLVDRKPGELLAAVLVPPLPPGAGWAFRKVGTRKAQALSKTSVAAIVAGTGIRVALGAVAPTIFRSRGLENRFAEDCAGDGRGFAGAAADIAAEYGRLVSPIDDGRSTARYRRNTAARLVAWALLRAAENR